MKIRPVIRILEPLGLSDQAMIASTKKTFNCDIAYQDTRTMSDAQLLSFIQEAHVLLLSNRCLSERVLKECPSLRLISVAFSGLDHIAVNTCKEKDILVKNAKGYAKYSVAELSILLTLNLLRKIPQTDKVLTSPFSTQLIGSELHGKCVGIIGGGEIGLATAKLFAAFGCRILVYHRRPIELRIEAAQQVPLNQLLSESDIISLHIPLTEESRHFLDQERLSMIKSTAIIINTARGPLIDQDALIKALQGSRLAGAALDVFDQEPPLDTNHPLLTAKNVLLTPHIGFQTREAIQQKAKMAFGHLHDWLQSL